MAVITGGRQLWGLSWKQLWPCKWLHEEWWWCDECCFLSMWLVVWEALLLCDSIWFDYHMKMKWYVVLVDWQLYTLHQGLWRFGYWWQDFASYNGPIQQSRFFTETTGIAKTWVAFVILLSRARKILRLSIGQWGGLLEGGEVLLLPSQLVTENFEQQDAWSQISQTVGSYGG